MDEMLSFIRGTCRLPPHTHSEGSCVVSNGIQKCEAIVAIPAGLALQIHLLTTPPRDQNGLELPWEGPVGILTNIRSGSDGISMGSTTQRPKVQTVPIVNHSSTILDAPACDRIWGVYKIIGRTIPTINNRRSGEIRPSSSCVSPGEHSLETNILI